MARSKSTKMLLPGKEEKARRSGEKTKLPVKKPGKSRSSKFWSNEALQKGLDHSEEIIFMTSREGIITYINNAFTNVYGYTKKEVVGKVSPAILGNGNISQDTIDDFWNNLLNKKVLKCEFVNKSKNGKFVNVESAISPIIDKDNYVQGFLEIQKNITERKKSELELIRNDKRYRSIIETTLDGFYLVNTEARILEANESYVSMIGYSREELLNMRVHDIEANDNDEDIKLRIKGLIEKGNANFETKHRRKDGTTIDIEANVFFMNESGGLLFCFMRDISYRKDFYKTLKRSEQRYKLFSEITSDYFFSSTRHKDGPYKIDWAGGAFEEITGFAIPEIFDRGGWTFLIHPEDSDRVLKLIEGLRPGQNESSEFRIVTKKGEVRWISEESRCIFHEELKDHYKLFGAAQDITDRKNAEFQLHALAKGISVEIGDAFFKSLVENLVVALGVDAAYIGLLQDSPSKKISTIAYFANGRERNNFEYELKDTPCDNVVGKKIIIYKSGAALLFSNDKLLQEMNIEGYIGIPLFSSEGKPLGLMVVLSKLPLKNTKPIEDMLHVFATRAAAELERKKVEDALKISEARFRGVINSMQDLVYTLDNEQKITGLYGMWAEMYGLTEELLLGKKLTTFLSPAESEINDVANLKALSGVPVKYEWSLKKNYDVFYFESSLTPLYGNSSEITGIVGVARDITNRKISEFKIKESEERYRKLFDYSPDPIIVYKNFEILFANSAAINLFGGSDISQFNGRNIFQFIHPEYHHLVIRRVKELDEGIEKLPIIHEKFIKLDGTIIDVEASTIAFFHQGERAVQVVLRDITERKKAEKQIQFQAELINVIHDTILLADCFGNIIYANEAAMKLHQYLFDEIAATNIKDLGPENAIDPIAKRIDKILKEGYDSFERFHKKKDGTVFPVEIDAQIIVLEDEKYILMVVRDLTERKIAEEQIKLQALLLDSAKDSIFLHDSNGKIVYANEEASKSRGFTREDILTKRIFDFVIPEEQLLFEQSVQKVFDEGKFTFETFHVKKDGSIFPIEIFVQLINIQGTDYFLSVSRDISERKKSETALRESEERYRNLIEYSPEAIAVHGNGKILYGNAAAVRYMGARNAEQIIGMPVMDVIHTDSKELAIERTQNLLNLGKPLPPVEEKIVRVDGSVMDIEVTSVPIIFDNKPAIQVIMRDITKKKHIESEIRKLSRAVDQSPAAIIITNVKGEIEYTNPKFVEVTGYTSSEALGQNPRILKSGLQDKDFYKNLWNTINAGNEWRGEFNNKKKSGELYWELTSISPIKNDKGEITHFLAVKEDITSRKKMESELIKSKEIAEEANKLKSSLLANMSHEFRTPLNGILGFSQLLRDEVTDQSQIDMIEKITRSGKRLMSTLNSVLTLTELENNNYLITNTEIDFVFFCQQMKSHHEKSASMKKLLLQVYTPVSELWINTDETLLTKIISCLVENAIKYTAEGEIGIKLETVKKNNKVVDVQIHVKDTGIGIDQEHQNLIFREFKQLSEGFRRDYEGLGLGLSLASRMATLIGGKITVDSSLGQGSTFTLTIPAIDTNELEITPTLPSYRRTEMTHNAPIKKSNDLINVLLVEDNSLNVEVVQRFLSKICKVSYSKTGLEAIKMAEENNYDLLMIDINLGHGMNGVEVLAEVKKFGKYAKVPVIALTGYASDSNKRDFLSQGFTHYLAKPFEKKELINVITTIMGRK
jgi:PAS domain S-box-containing protein